MEDQIRRSDTSDSTAEYVVPVFTTEGVPRIRARESKDAKVGNLATRRAFLLKSVGVLGGVALGVYLAPSLNTLRVHGVHANAQVSPCPTSTVSTSYNGTDSTASSLCTTSDR